MANNAYTLAGAKGFLAIDRDDLDTCLMQQPELFHQVSDQYTEAVSERDGLKLALEELQAELGEDFRRRAAQADEKLTEGALTSKLRTAPRVQAVTREYLAACKKAEQWNNLKESFKQRSFALRELVALRLGERRDLELESGAGQYKAVRAEEIRAKQSKLRKAQLRK